MCVNQRFVARVILHPGASGAVWRGVWRSSLGPPKGYWHQVDRDQGCSPPSCDAQDRCPHHERPSLGVSSAEMEKPRLNIPQTARSQRSRTRRGEHQPASLPAGQRASPSTRG